MLGVKAQETMLGTFEISGKTKIVCACRDFTADGKQLCDVLTDTAIGIR